MIIAGILLVTAGLVNSFLGIHQPSSPFDSTEGIAIESSTGKSQGNTSQGTDIAFETGKAASLPVQDLVDDSSNETKADPPQGLVPERLVIPAINLDAQVVPTKLKEIDYQGQKYYQWLAPNKPAVGWHDASALLGLPGNTVLNGHHNVYGKVFKDLVNVHEGDEIEVYSGEIVFKYRVVLTMLLPERFKSLTIRLENARWILPTEDERLTLITCWPADSNTHRVIIIALPAD